MASKLDGRQVISRNTLSQLIPNVSGQELDNLLRSIDSDLTDPLRMDAASTPSLVVSIGAAVIFNIESNRKRSISHINGFVPSFTSGTITFPASSGGTITVSPGINNTLTVSSGSYIKATVYLDNSGNLAVTMGIEGVSESAATIASAPVNTMPVGYIVIHNTGGTIDNVTQANLYQFDGRSAASTGGGGGALPEGFQHFVKSSTAAAVASTQINKRALVNHGLHPAFSVEPIRFGVALEVMQKEFSTVDGKIVHKLPNDSRLRFVGNWYSVMGTWGHTFIGPASDFVEISLYGTGLIMYLENVNVARDIRVTVDGGVESSNLVPNLNSNIIGDRNYQGHIQVKVVSGLTLGIHTVKIRNAHASSAFPLQGFDILTESSTFAIKAGTGVIFGSDEVTADSLTAYNAGVSGTKGGRVIKYLQSGAISQAVTNTNVTALYLLSTDHSNEDVVERIYWRQFGSNRGDDFSTLTAPASDRWFTLPDNTTSLTGDDVFVYGGTNGPYLVGDTTSTAVTFTFVGTGLDLLVFTDGTGPWNSQTFYIDGVSIGAVADISGRGATESVITICSGLPYGTHTFKWTRNAVGANVIGIKDFIVYQPKKPTIPSDALEIADYCVFADYAVCTQGLETVSQGVLRKHSAREFFYSNHAWSINDIVGTYISGIAISTAVSGAYCEKIFYGTGFNLRWKAHATRSATITPSLNGITLTSANFPTASFSVFGAGTSAYNAGTGTLSEVGSDAAGAGFTCTGLPLGFYVLRFTNGAALPMVIDCLDIITPIHSYDPMFSSAAFRKKLLYSPVPEKSTPIDFGKAKAWVVYDATDNTIKSSYNIALVTDTAVGVHRIHFLTPFIDENYVVSGSAGARLLGLESDNNLGIRTRTPSYCEVTVSDISSHADEDVQSVSVVFFGELLDETK